MWKTLAIVSMTGVGVVPGWLEDGQLVVAPEFSATSKADTNGPSGVPPEQLVTESKPCKPSVSRGKRAFDRGDYNTAFCHWWPKAEAGDAAAQNNMGVLFENGFWVPQSDFTAADWYSKSANQGFTLAMRNLARVQERLGYVDAAASWLRLADQTERNHRAQTDAAVSSFGWALGCALAGGCPSANYQPPSWGNGSPTDWRESGAQSYSPTANSLDAVTMCPDGSYVAGTRCWIAPNGQYLGGPPTIAPDGTYVAGAPRIAPSGKYIGGTGPITICPDGSYVSGQCRLTPAGTYIGD